ncbi:MAG: 50S ribosomal protein L6 [Nevskia sp.]|jgi:large subunit ribosomal protein L6|uniref:50S ribosomal protein L6 n=1 Tax=Nevskia sp. TaxID=1929292 RepID=UPI004035D279
MSRVAKMPVVIPAGVEFKSSATELTVKGAKSSLSLPLPKEVKVEYANGTVTIAEASVKASPAMSGTIRALLASMVVGVTKGYEKKLTLVGVGYRATLTGKKLNLAVGLSHPVDFMVPDGITITVPTQTEVVIQGADKRVVGQIAATLRGYRPPEPYKGKGVRYSDEKIVLKEAKKK